MWWHSACIVCYLLICNGNQSLSVSAVRAVTLQWLARTQEPLSDWKGKQRCFQTEQRTSYMAKCFDSSRRERLFRPRDSVRADLCAYRAVLLCICTVSIVYSSFCEEDIPEFTDELWIQNGGRERNVNCNYQEVSLKYLLLVVTFIRASQFTYLHTILWRFVV